MRCVRYASRTAQAALLAAVTFVTAKAAATVEMPLRLAQTIPLPGVHGRIDHLAVDLPRRRLFVAALANDSVEVVDLRGGTHLRSLPNFRQPQGIVFVDEKDQLFVANGGTGVLDIVSGKTLRRRGGIAFAGDADAIRYDAAKNRIYLGYGSGGLGIIDPERGRRIGAVGLPAHPESFSIASSRHEAFVNVPGANQIAVIDLEARRVAATWALPAGSANFPSALDEEHRRLLVGLRHPPELAVFDTRSGKRVAGVASVGDADDIFYDGGRRRVYVSGGDGFLDVFDQRDPDHYARIAHVPTVPGARTSLFVPALDRLYLAVPARGARQAEIRVYAF
jgi:DNA-binding beta-propeller fold protein YncE